MCLVREEAGSAVGVIAPSGGERLVGFSPHRVKFKRAPGSIITRRLTDGLWQIQRQEVGVGCNRSFR